MIRIVKFLNFRLCSNATLYPFKFLVKNNFMNHQNSFQNHLGGTCIYVMHCSPLKSSGILAHEEKLYIRFYTNIFGLYKIFVGSSYTPVLAALLRHVYMWSRTVLRKFTQKCVHGVCHTWCKASLPSVKHERLWQVEQAVGDPIYMSPTRP